MIEGTDRDFESVPAEDEDTRRLVARFKAGDREAYATLYTRYFERVYAYLKVALRNIHDAEDLTQQVFTQALEHLPAYSERGKPFRAWLFTIARNLAVTHLRKQSRIVLEDPADIATRIDAQGGENETEIKALGWIKDYELLIFIERLPLSQQQVLVLRYLLDMKAGEIATVLNRTPNEVRMLQHRAQKVLRERLVALGRAPDPDKPEKPAPKQAKRSGWQARKRQSVVLRERRFQLWD